MSVKHDFETLLRNAGMKATPKRIALLGFLADVREPVSVVEMKKTLGKKVDSVTIYRALEALTGAGIVKRVDFHEPEARYELVIGRTHHHHIVCNDCGVVEDVDLCASAKLERKALGDSKRFVAISSHALEFFGTCESCFTK